MLDVSTISNPWSNFFEINFHGIDSHQVKIWQSCYIDARTSWNFSCDMHKDQRLVHIYFYIYQKYVTIFHGL